MGRVKLKIKRLESTSNRQVTYSKRRHGILKKARELAILCDIDIALLMFSPTGRSTLYQGENRNFEEVIAKFSQLTPQERAKRKLESLEALKKTFKKLDHDVNIEDFLGSSSQTVEELGNRLRLLQVQLTELQKRLSYWSDPEKIDNVENLRQMEDSLRESIQQIRLQKENFGKHQLTSLECATQFQNGMPLPILMNGVHDAQSLSWLSNNDNQHMLFPHEPNFLPQRDVECSSDVSLPGYSGYFSTEKKDVVGNTIQLAHMGSGGGTLDELSRNTCLSMQLGEQYAYPSYGSSNLLDDNKLKPQMEMNLQVNPLDYQINSNFGVSRPLCDSGHHTWFSASAPCSISIYNQNGYQCNQIDSQEPR
ncbi:agamous-like MADS-box protein AGL65 [Castanea sativa]|uniref:agamous-like MADS-box protein AGL65 n=1 Tax=Castanea sativa TaxID=21020 RepID=UPI003F6531C6